MGTWNKNIPRETDSFADIPMIAQDNFDATEGLLGKEHYTFNEALCGMHIPGVMGVVKSAGTAVIEALSSPGSGAMAWDATLGWWKRYWNDEWGYPGSGTKWSRVRAYKSASNQNLTAVGGDSETEVIVLDEENYDALDEFAANTFTALDSGHYMVVASWTASGAAAESAGVSATYPASAVQEKMDIFNSAVPTGTTSNEWTIVGASTAHEAIDDIGDPVTTDYLQSNGINNGDSDTALFTIGNFSVPSAAAVSAVRILIYCNTGGSIPGASRFRGLLTINGTTYSTSDIAGTTSARFQVFSWTTNPDTSSSWAVDDVNGTGSNPLSGFGFLRRNAIAGQTLARVYQAQVQVIYTHENNNYASIDESTVNYLDGLLDETAGGLANAEIVSGTNTLIPTSSTNLSAYLEIVARRLTTTANTLVAGLRVGTTNYYSTAGPVTPASAALDTNYGTYAFTWSANPATEAAWTEGQFEGTAANALSGFGGFIVGSSVSADIIRARLLYYWDSPDPEIAILLRKNSVVVASASKPVSSPEVETDEQIKLVDMVYLTAGETLDIQAKKTVTNDVVVSGSDATYLAIHRLGSQGL